MLQPILPGVEQSREAADEEEFAECRDQQRCTRQHHDDEQIDDRQPEREKAPRPEVERPWPEGFSRHRCKASAREHALLQENQLTRHHHQERRDRGGGAVKRWRPGCQIEDVGR